MFQPADERTDAEISPMTGIIVQQMAEFINTNGGSALLADYGHDGEKTDTFRVCNIFLGN